MILFIIFDNYKPKEQRNLLIHLIPEYMKKLLVIPILTFSFSVFTNLCSAQFNTYHPFPDSNAAWRETSFWQNTTVTYNEYDYYMRGDTMVNGKKYFKLNLSGGYQFTPWGPPDTTWQCYNSLTCLIREDTLARKIYGCFPNYTKDTLLYDFNLHVGDTLPASYIKRQFDTETVKSVDSILVGNTYRRQFIIMINEDTYHNYVFDSLIEGIGSSEGLLELMYPPFESGSSMDCFTNATTQFSYGSNSPCNIFYKCPINGIANINKPAESITVYPNPGNGVFTIEVNPDSYRDEKLKVNSVEVYNVLGEEVYNSQFLPQTPKGAMIEVNIASQPNGVYFYRVFANNGEFVGDGKVIVQK
jgi:hypothetical protein